MAKIEADSRFDSASTLRVLAVTLQQLANEKDKDEGKPELKIIHKPENSNTAAPGPAASLFNNKDDGGDGNDLGNDGNAGTAQQDAGGAPAAPSDPSADKRVDHKGVAFDAEFCANAEDPFYNSGPRKGQWKKRRGVDEGDYDDWYTDALADLPEVNASTNTAGENDGAGQVNTKAAFAAQQANQQQPAATDKAPATVGDFMAWVSELQAGGRLSQTQVGDCYSAASVEITDLFPPNPPEVIAEKIAAVYAEIKALL